MNWRAPELAAIGQQAAPRYPGYCQDATFGVRAAIWGDTALIPALATSTAFVYTRVGVTWNLQQEWG